MTERLFLIVLSDTAKNKLKKLDPLNLLDGDLRTLCSIRLYSLSDRKDVNKTVVAMPLENGKILLLIKDDKENYFICIGVNHFKYIPWKSKDYYHELPGDVKIRVVSSPVGSHYLADAVDCGEIDREVKAKKPWNPHEGSSPEEKKWVAYLKLFESELESQKFGLPVNVIKTRKNEIQVMPDYTSGIDSADIEEKIKKARGETVHFLLTMEVLDKTVKNDKRELGILRKFNNNMDIELSEKFSDSVQEQIKMKEFYVKIGDCFYKPSIEFAKTDNSAQTDFYYDREGKSPSFSCRAEIKNYDDEGKMREFSHHNEINKLVSQIDPDSVELKRVMLSADFIGNFHQVKVMKSGLKKIKERLIWEVLSCERVSDLPQDEEVEWHDNCRLNDKQKEAVKKALNATELCMIWGPPGTGKTEVIAEIARQEALRGNKTLISSQANLAVDNALARLYEMPDVWTFRVAKEEYKLEGDDINKVPMMNTAADFFGKWLQGRLCIENQLFNADIEINKIRDQLIKSLNKKFNKKYERDMSQMAKLYRNRINVVGATLMRTGKSEWDRDANGKICWDTERNKLCSELGIKEFDSVIVDEISKATPVELFLPILLGKRIILVGDHKQLPPMLEIASGDSHSLEEWAEEAKIPTEDLDIETTLFERLWEKHKDIPQVRAMLTKQYRMHFKIQRLVKSFYTDSDGKLECGISEEEQRNMSVASDGVFAGRHAIWVDTNNNSMESQDGTSFANNDEIQIVKKLLQALPNDNKLSVGVITFYGAQLRRLCDEIKPLFSKKFPDGKLIFGTVDRFQGRECDVIICSLVRKNKKGNIGFAAKPNRINVAFSRARRLLCIVGNSGHFCYESRNNDARDKYKDIYDNCDRIFEKDILGAS